ncbi:glycine cleavage H-protein [Gloeopeniophorella convolvens]|nr:glycine cleavage H-protein [Gloeopeniophorella convolvens]
MSAQRVMHRAPLTLRRTVVTKHFTQDHEAVKFDSDTGVGTVTITDYAQKSLGDIVFVELPEEGATIEKGESVGAVESVKAASDIFAPVSGEVISINTKLGESPSLLNKSPEEDGWLYQLNLSEPGELESLLTEEQYKEFCES